MSKLLKTILLSLLVLGSLLAYASKDLFVKSTDAMHCDEVLKLSSGEFVDKYSQAHGDNTLSIADGIARYGVCYEKNLDATYDKLVEQGHAPLMGANANFRDFESALNDFRKMALEFCGPEGTLRHITGAYALLYAKQFRYHFYQKYVSQGVIPSINEEAVARAKAKLEEIFNGLPANQSTSLRESFSKCYTAGVTGLGLPAQRVYEYAIMLTQSLEEQEFAPPPF